MSAWRELPYIDEHAVEIDAGLDNTWAAVSDFGSTLPGFHVEVSEPGQELALAGRHWFSNYALTFRLDELGSGRTRLRAESRAEFPGLKGRAYRAMVIGTRGHVLAVRRMLAVLKRRAERDPSSSA